MNKCLIKQETLYMGGKKGHESRKDRVMEKEWEKGIGFDRVDRNIKLQGNQALMSCVQF